MSKIKILLSALGNENNYKNALSSVDVLSDIYTGTENLNNYNGLLLCGGGDVSPEFYNEALNGSKNINVIRDLQEFYLIDKFLNANKPILAICRGFQVLNVHLGGTLVQHLKNANMHQNDDGSDIYHLVKAQRNSFLGKLYGEEFIVNSHHHQAINKLAPSIHGTCYSGDGVLEGYENLNLKIIATQFHPERLNNEIGVNGSKIFKEFLGLI